MALSDSHIRKLANEPAFDMKTIALLFVATLYSLPGYSQDVTATAIQWNVVKVLNLTTNTSDDNGDKLLVYPGDRIEWRDGNDKPRIGFVITSFIGTWDNVNENGLIHFNFEYSGQPGELIIQRSAGMLSADILLYQIDADAQAYRFQIDSYTVL